MRVRGWPPAVRILAAAGVLLAVAWGGAIGYLKLNERDLIYIPAARHVESPPAELRLAERRVTFPSTDGVTLSAWIVPGESPDTGLWLLICHGNYGNVGFGARPRFYAFMRGLGLSVLAFDYRGYGESTGQPEEQGLYDDAASSYAYLTTTGGVSPERVVIFGHSLGTGVATELATKVRAGGLILEAPYTSIVDVGQERYPLMPVSLVASQRFPSLDRIASVGMPKLFLHSPDDAVIPFAHGRRMFEAAGPPKWFVSVRGGHDEAFEVDGGTYAGAVARFLSRVRASNP
jgi:fermentation-respiration switch protein FrsA (DUF1100 family)